MQTQIKFHHQFHFTGTFKCFIFENFKICFQHLVYLEMISFEKNSHTEVCNVMYIISVQGFSLLVTQTSGAFLLNI